MIPFPRPQAVPETHRASDRPQPRVDNAAAQGLRRGVGKQARVKPKRAPAIQAVEVEAKPLKYIQHVTPLRHCGQLNTEWVTVV